MSCLNGLSYYRDAKKIGAFCLASDEDKIKLKLADRWTKISLISTATVVSLLVLSIFTIFSVDKNVKDKNNVSLFFIGCVLAETALFGVYDHIINRYDHYVRDANLVLNWLKKKEAKIAKLSG